MPRARWRRAHPRTRASESHPRCLCLSLQQRGGPPCQRQRKLCGSPQGPPRAFLTPAPPMWEGIGWRVNLFASRAPCSMYRLCSVERLCSAWSVWSVFCSVAASLVLWSVGLAAVITCLMSSCLSLLGVFLLLGLLLTAGRYAAGGGPLRGRWRAATRQVAGRYAAEELEWEPFQKSLLFQPGFFRQEGWEGITPVCFLRARVRQSPRKKC